MRGLYLLLFLCLMRGYCMNGLRRLLPAVGALVLLIQVDVWSADTVEIAGELTVWQPVSIELDGPKSDEQAAVNPFLDYRVTVEFSLGTQVHVVPAYFAADGRAWESSATGGDRWRAHFVPGAPGKWSYRISVRKSPRIALQSGAEIGEPGRGDGVTGSFEIRPDSQASGVLRYVGERYLQYSGSGRFFLKSGADSPENLLAYHDFDGTAKGSSQETRRGEATGAGLHRYQPHVRDWQKGDPVWKGDRGKGLIGALNYLASQGVNSVYFLTMNVRGDGNDVWPWTAWEERFRFDCSKLEQWEVVFSHMDQLGIALHVVLTETENESLLEYEEKNTFADSRKLYYREMIARFGHHRGVVWNIGEENGWDDRKNKDALDEDWRAANTTEQRKAFAHYLREVDPYDHPIVVHTLPGRYEEIYRSLLGDESFDGVSLQVQLGPKIHEETKKWIVESGEAGRQWFANLDEIGPASDGVKPDADDPEHDDVRRYALWGNLMAGGSGCEWYFGYKFAHNDLNLEDFRSRAAMWRQTRYAVEFFQEHLSFWEMNAADELCQTEGVYCLADSDEVYALYLPEGSGRIDLPKRKFGVQWFDPRRGGSLQRGSVATLQGGPATDVGKPPTAGTKDWVVLLRRSE